MYTVLFFLIKFVVPLFHGYGAAFFFNIFYDLRQFFPCNGNHLHQKGRRINAVFAFDVSADRKAAGRFPADHGVCGIHSGGNVLESHRDLIAFLSKSLRHLIQHMGRADITHHRACPAFILDQVIVKQHKDIVWMKEPSCIVNHADPVSVAVGGNANVTFFVKHIIL